MKIKLLVAFGDAKTGQEAGSIVSVSEKHGKQLIALKLAELALKKEPAKKEKNGGDI